MTFRPSETEEGLLWLNNFDLEERHAAELLINSLRIVSSSRFRVSLSDLLIQLREECVKPIVIYPIRELPKEIAPLVEASETAVGQERMPDGTYMPLLPLDHSFESLPGSEGVVGNIIRAVIGNRPDRTIATSPRTLSALRRTEPRTVILVDDYSGTGTRVSQYVDSWMRHPTIRSWYSYKLISFHIALVTASGYALETLRKHRRIEDTHYCEQAADFLTAMWSPEERQAIEQLCIKYSYSPKFELGFQSARGLLVLQHTVPNNLPAVLWQTSTKRISNWAPFFAGRRMTPQQQHDLDDYKLEISATDIANSMQQFRLGAALADQPNPTVRLILLVLAASARRIRDPRELSTLLRTTVVSAEQTQKACQDLDLLDSDGRLTDRGRAELRRARARADVAQRPQLKGRDDAYYPTHLRGVGEI
jgi:hypothetical protein